MKKIKWPIGILVFGLLAFSFTTFFWDLVNTEYSAKVDKIEEKKGKTSVEATPIDNLQKSEPIQNFLQERTTVNEADSSKDVGTSVICTDSTHSQTSSKESKSYERRKPSTAKVISSYVSGFFSLIGFGWTVYGILKEVRERRCAKAKAKARAEKRAKTAAATRARVAADENTKKMVKPLKSVD